MAPRLTVKRIEEINRLRGRLKYENKKAGGKVFPNLTTDYLNQNYARLNRAKKAIIKKRKEERDYKRTILKISAYNDKIPPSKSKYKIANFLSRDLFKKKNKQAIKLVKLLNKLNKTPSGKQIDKLREALKPFVRFKKGKNGYPVSPLLATRSLENKLRLEQGLLTVEQENYNNNFKKAMLRVGAYGLYRRALIGGSDFIADLYRRGFDIQEVYHTESDYAPIYQTKETLSAIGIDIDDPDTFPTLSAVKKLKTTFYGKDVEDYAKRLLKFRL